MKIEDFPVEILQYIFEKLAPHDVLHCSWTCSNWRKATLCHLLWKKVLLWHHTLEGDESIQTTSSCIVDADHLMSKYMEHRRNMHRWRSRSVISKEVIWKETSPRSQEGDTMFIQSKNNILLLGFSSGRIESWRLTYNLEYVSCMQHPGRIINMHYCAYGLLVSEDNKLIVYKFMSNDSFVSDENCYVASTYSFSDSIQSHLFGSHVVCACRHTVHLFSLANNFEKTELKVPERYVCKDMQCYKVLDPVLLCQPYVFGCSVDDGKDAWLICWNLDFTSLLWVVFTGERIPKLWYDANQNLVYMCDRRGSRVWAIKVQNGTTSTIMDLDVGEDEEDEIEVEINVSKNLLVTCTCCLNEIKLYNLRSGEQIWKGDHPNIQIDSLLHKSFFHGDFFITVSWDTLYLWDIGDSELSLVLATGYPPLMTDISVKDSYIAVACSSQDAKLFRLFLLSTYSLHKF